MENSREVFLFLNPFTRMIFYILSGISLLIFIAGMVSRISLWFRGENDREGLLTGSTSPLNPVKIISTIFKYSLSRECLLAERVFRRSTIRGFMLILLYWGFMILFAGTVVVAVDHYLRLRLLQGIPYLLFSFILDIAGLGVLIGVVFFIIRRLTLPEDKIVSGWDDIPLLILMAIIVLSGFLLEGLRLFIQTPPLYDLSPVGAIFSIILRWIGPVKDLYEVFWFLHILSALIFIAFVPFSKQFHMFASQITTREAEQRRKRLKEFVHAE